MATSRGNISQFLLVNQRKIRPVLMQRCPVRRKRKRIYCVALELFLLPGLFESSRILGHSLCCMRQAWQYLNWAIAYHVLTVYMPVGDANATGSSGLSGIEFQILCG